METNRFQIPMANGRQFSVHKRRTGYSFEHHIVSGSVRLCCSGRVLLRYCAIVMRACCTGLGQSQLWGGDTKVSDANKGFRRYPQSGTNDTHSVGLHWGNHQWGFRDIDWHRERRVRDMFDYPPQYDAMRINHYFAKP
jgi:hypothetical protein